MGQAILCCDDSWPCWQAAGGPGSLAIIGKLSVGTTQWLTGGPGHIAPWRRAASSEHRARHNSSIKKKGAAFFYCPFATFKWPLLAHEHRSGGHVTTPPNPGTPTLPELTRLHYQDALDWRKWTKWKIQLPAFVRTVLVELSSWAAAATRARPAWWLGLGQCQWPAAVWIVAAPESLAHSVI